MKGIRILENLRKSGLRPQTVWVNFDHCKLPKYSSEYVDLQLGYGDCKDLRPFVGCDVILFSELWKPEIGALYERLKQYAKTISVLVCEFDTDLGWWWSKEKGKVAYG